ncbi:MAG: ORF6N domain-containing protein [Thiomicrorhabdus sp.]|nr:ORF6N domain-containing protein [Thiomicrorhabdus sp.]
MKNELIQIKNIQERIYTIRGLEVMIDYHLAEIYSVETKRLNEQVKRNIERFPQDFMFQLTKDEWGFLQSKNATTESENNLQAQNATAKRRSLPYVFTEQGVAMLSAVLRSETAVRVSLQIIHAFVEMKRFITTNAGLFQRLDKVEQKLINHDENFDKIFKALEEKSIKPNQGIFFNGQVFDAYNLIADIIRSANKSIILIDNYVDDSVLKLLTKRKNKVTTVIYTKNISKTLRLDIDIHNKEYDKIKLKKISLVSDPKNA